MEQMGFGRKLALITSPGPSIDDRKVTVTFKPLQIYSYKTKANSVSEFEDKKLF